MGESIAKNNGLLFKIVTNLTFWVLIAIISGVLVGHYLPETGTKMKVIGDTFIQIVKLFIAPIIFLTIVLGISGMGDLRKVGRIGIKALVYFEIVTTFALAIGIIAAYIIQPGKIDKSGLDIQDASKYTSNPRTEFDWWQFFMDNFTLQVLALAIVCGILLNYYNKRESVVATLYKASKLFSRL
jgi:aerobic C4-dicarboxylate transport protein